MGSKPSHAQISLTARDLSQQKTNSKSVTLIPYKSDIKPANLLVTYIEKTRSKKLRWFTKTKNTIPTEEPHLYIGDFGLVNKKGGTPIYMAPEAFEKPVNGLSDVYSLGKFITIYFPH